MPLRQLEHYGVGLGRTRNKQLQFVVGGWVGEIPTSSWRLGMCNGTHNRDSPSDTFGKQTSGSLVKGRVVSHQWQSLDLWFNLSPDLRKHPGIHGILHGKSMHPCVPIRVILRLWLDETVVAIHNLTIHYYHNANGAYACALLVGSQNL